MPDYSIYKDIAERTDGDIYIGVVGPVRTGKSTLIKRFISDLALPNIKSEHIRERARDEMPQSASGRTVMTTEPKFVPEEAVTINIDENSSFNLKMIDCVGYIVPDAIGHIEEGVPRMVMTPWSSQAMPFEQAAETGTRKVINEHSTIGLLVTTDGSIGEIPRKNYLEAEKRVANELKAIHKPFIIILNTTAPASQEAVALAASLSEEYGVSAIPVNCLEMTESDIKDILRTVLYEFPVREVKFTFPGWFESLEDEHPVKQRVMSAMYGFAGRVSKVGEIKKAAEVLKLPEDGISGSIASVELGNGSAEIAMFIPDKLFYQILGEKSGFEISNEKDLFGILTHLAVVQKEYGKVSEAIREVRETGYGIVSPSMEDLKLEEPVIVKQAGGYGVKLKASAPSIHMIRANIETEVSPIVGTERQSEELVRFMLKEFEEDPKKIWDSNMFGKSLHELVNEGLNTKLTHMPDDARTKLAETLQKIINDGSGGLICILL
ncbi:MAG: stage IV sporulation protein A [Eubacteriales bacterium]|nr:stage IV sporulation protein A [Eubacteriales bacterium]